MLTFQLVAAAAASTLAVSILQSSVSAPKFIPTDPARAHALASHLIMQRDIDLDMSGATVKPKPGKPLTDAEIAAAQECNDRVASGQRFPPIKGYDEPPAPPPMVIDPHMDADAKMVERCLAHAGYDDITVFAVAFEVKKPLLR